MSIGYACLTIGVPGTDLKTCRMKNADEPRLQSLIGHNLSALEKQVDYNVKNGVRLFRISSDIIPFGSSPANGLRWDEAFGPDFDRIGGKIRASGMRVSMHPGQYTVLGSPDETTAGRAAEDLRYHARFLDALGAGPDSKIILHLGGVHGSREETIGRFARRFEKLDERVRRRLVLENDEKSYNIGEVLEAARMIGVPAVFDSLHHAVRPAPEGSEEDWIRECARTWKPADGRQKIHYSQQAQGLKPGAHSGTIHIDEFLDFYGRVSGGDLDIMLEVKDKNISALKCIACTSPQPDRAALEREWARYKYLVLERSHAAYLRIRELFRETGSCPALDFYRLAEAAAASPPDAGGDVNAALHVWGYFRGRASESEKRRFFSLLGKVGEGGAAAPVKAHLLRLAVKYEQGFLLDSLYFYLP